MLMSTKVVTRASRFLIGLLAVVPFGLTHAEGTDVSAPLIFSSGLESGTLAASGFRVSGGGSNTAVVTTERARSGSRSLKSVLDAVNSVEPDRTEVVLSGTQTAVGNEYWYGFSIFLPNDFIADDIWEIVAQWHDTPDSSAEYGRNPILSFQTQKGIWKIMNLWDDKATSSKVNGAWTYTGKKSWDLGAYSRGVWTDWVVNVRWSYTSSGYLKIWKDGKLVVDQVGPNTFNDKIGPYFKMGIYKGWGTRRTAQVSVRTIYHDDLTIAGAGATYADVAPGSGITRLPNPPAALKVQ
jgi:hypothetical protein